mgnify:CR=1 FL=1
MVLLADILQGANEQASELKGELVPDNPVTAIDLFAGALFPGLLLVGLYLFYQIILASTNPSLCPALVENNHNDKVTGSEINFFQLLKVILSPLILIIVVLGSILTGIATPTESAAVGAVGATIIAIVSRQFNIEILKEFENNGINYIIKDPELFKNKNIVISGGGDSALDWALYFANDYSKSVTLVHRSQQFRAHNDSVQKAMDMASNGKINLLLDIEQGNNLHEIAKNNLKKRSTININDQNKLDKINKHNDVISSIGYHYPMYDENTNQILLFLKSAKNISCYRENEHLLNLEVLDEIERTGFPLLLAIFCENIITETANES